MPTAPPSSRADHHSRGDFATPTGDLSASTLLAEGLGAADRALEGKSPGQVLAEAVRGLGEGLVLTTAFGLEGSVLIDVIGRHRLPIRIVTLDTGLFFDATRAAWRSLEARYDLAIEAARPELDLDEQAEAYGADLWARDPDACCALRKVAPLTRVLRSASGWITGIRRDQTPERSTAPTVGWDPRFRIPKLNPLAGWSLADVRAHLHRHDVPYNPMFDDGYPSVGCTPCTRAVADHEDPRAGRWSGHLKRECGLHWDTGVDGPRLIHLRRGRR